MEADYVGLMMMAEACYDPRAAVGLWQRFEALQKRRGMEIPEFLSTHPAVSGIYLAQVSMTRNEDANEGLRTYTGYRT